jgi:hypothetical protein
MVPVAKPIILAPAKAEQATTVPSSSAESISSDDAAKGDSNILQPQVS